MALALIITLTLLPLAILTLDLLRKRQGVAEIPTNLTVAMRPAATTKPEARAVRRSSYVPGTRYPTDGRSRQAVFGAR